MTTRHRVPPASAESPPDAAESPPPSAETPPDAAVTTPHLRRRITRAVTAAAPRARRAARRAATLAARPFQLARRQWRRSLYTRVAVSTFLLSGLVVVGLGVALLDQVTASVLRSTRNAALTELASGAVTAARQLDSRAADTRPFAVDATALSVGRSLNDLGATAPATFQVALLPVSLQDRGYISGGLTPASGIPAALRTAVATAGGREAYTYTLLRYNDGATAPALVAGAVVGRGPTAYQLFYLFPLRQQAQTVALIRRILVGAGAAIVLLLVGLVALVIRQVVTPVRVAARTAERFAAGRLEQRMRVRGEDDLARLADSFNRMAERLQRQIRRLEELSRMQQRFVADVSHELRTPLTTVQMAADVLYNGRTGFPGETSRAAELLHAQLDRFAALLADLLEISRHDAGAAVLDTEPVDLCQLVRAAVEAVAPLAERRGSPVRLDLPAEPVVVEVDPRRLDRVLRNLITNAVEHGAGQPVTVDVRGTAEAAAVLVADQGLGLRPGESSLVFQRFWRADPSRARSTGGTGLGLAIALEDVRLHGGWLQAWGEPGRGARFRMTVPCQAGGALQTSPLPLAPPEPPEPAGPPSPAVPPSSGFHDA